MLARRGGQQDLVALSSERVYGPPQRRALGTSHGGCKDSQTLRAIIHFETGVARGTSHAAQSSALTEGFAALQGG